MPLAEREIQRAELYISDEAFFTAEVAPILSIDRKPIGNGKPGKITSKLREEYERVVTGRNNKYLDYLTPVYDRRQIIQATSEPNQ